MAQILDVEIRNFLSIEQSIEWNDFENKNLFSGLFHTVKKDVWKAIIFALGAKLEDIGVSRYANLKNRADVPTYVCLRLKYNHVVSNVKRTVDGNEQSFSINGDPVAGDNVMEKYQTFLKRFRIDLSKQILLCDTRNVIHILNMLLTEPHQLFGDIMGLAEPINEHSECNETYKQHLVSEAAIRRDIRELNGIIKSLESALPVAQYSAQFAEYTISHLKRQEAERIVKKGEFAVLDCEETQIETDMLQFAAEIACETRRRDEKVETKQNINAILIEMDRQGFLEGQDNALLLKLKRLMFQKATILALNDLDLVEKLEGQKKEIESNITFMTGASGTNRKSNMISDENLRKLYPLYHGKDEFEMDKLEFQLLKAETQLKIDANVQETLDYFDEVLPQKKCKQMEAATTIGEIFSECNAALKDIFHPNAYIQSIDELKLEKLRSLIPSDKGFLLSSAFRPIAEEHRPLIEHILVDYKYTIALFKDDQQFMFDKLKKECSEWYTNVKYFVINKLPNSTRGEYVAPPDHWLNYCTFTITNIDLKSRRNLISYMGKQLEIKRVDSHEDVRDAYQLQTKKYVASVDGQLIYTTHSMGFDVLKYFRPGKKVSNMQFSTACQRVEEAVRKLGEFTSTFVETVNVPRERPVPNPNVNRDEVEQLRDAFAEKKERMNVQLEALRIRLNAPYESPNVQNYADELVVERRKLDDINRRLFEAQNVFAGHKNERDGLEAYLNQASTYLGYKRDLDVIELGIVELNKSISTKTKQLKELTKTLAENQIKSDELYVSIKNLKYETMKTVLSAHQANVDWTVVDAAVTRTVPPTLWQDIRNGHSIPPYDISIDFNDITDTFHPDVCYTKSTWYPILQRHQNKTQQLTEKISKVNEILQDANQRYNRLQCHLLSQFAPLSMIMTELLNNIGKEVHPNVDREYKFNVYIGGDYRRIIEIKIDGDVLGFESLSKPDKVCTSWVLFAAFHQYVHAPFVFVSLDELDKETVTLVHSVAAVMSRRAQLFVDNSTVLYTHFAEVLYGIGKNDPTDGCFITLKHDGRLFMRTVSSDDERSDGEDDDGRNDERAGERVDGERVDRLDPNAERAGERIGPNDERAGERVDHIDPNDKPASERLDPNEERGGERFDPNAERAGEHVDIVDPNDERADERV